MYDVLNLLICWICRESLREHVTYLKQKTFFNITWQEAGVVSGDTLTAVARNMQIVAHDQGVAFAAVRSDGRVQTWGCKEDGGDSRAVKLVTSIFGSDS